MATKPSKVIIRGIEVLKLLSQNPGRLKTVPALQRQAPHLSVGQIEGALLAYAEVGMVQVTETDAGPVYCLLGTFHLRLAMAEIEGLLHGTASLQTTLNGLENLRNLRALLSLLKPQVKDV